MSTPRGKAKISEQEKAFAKANSWGYISVSRKYGQVDCTYTVVMNGMPGSDVEQMTTYGKKSWDSNQMSDKGFMFAMEHAELIEKALEAAYAEVEAGTAEIYVWGVPKK